MNTVALDVGESSITPISVNRARTLTENASTTFRAPPLRTPCTPPNSYRKISLSYDQRPAVSQDVRKDAGVWHCPPR